MALRIGSSFSLPVPRWRSRTGVGIEVFVQPRSAIATEKRTSTDFAPLMEPRLVPAAVWSQDWRATARFGRVTYEGAPAAASGR